MTRDVTGGALPAAGGVPPAGPEVSDGSAPLARLEEIPPQGQGALRLRVGGTPIGLFRLEDRVVAWRDVCPHQAAPVCRGTVTGTRLPSTVSQYQYGRDQEILRCPWHGWEFDLVTGEHLAQGSGARLRPHPIEVREGAVFDASGRGFAHVRDLIVTSSTLVGRALELELSAADGRRLPAWTPGAHIDLALPSGQVRHYSLCGDDRDRDRFRIAPQLEPDGRGGSVELHRLARPGARLRMTGIRNRFPLRYSRRYLFLAAGIGITPILAMVRAVARRRGTYDAVYIGRDRDTMPLAEEFGSLPGTTVVSTAASGRPDLDALIASSPEGTAIYACGPEGFITEIEESVASRGGSRSVHSEDFSPATPAPAVGADHAVDVTLARSGTTVRVSAEESILGALRRHGITRSSSCESGWCGSCETGVLEGIPVHRDSVLDEFERETGTTMMICVGRAVGPLTLDV